MKRYVTSIILIIITVLLGLGCKFSSKTISHLQKRLDGYAYAIDYEFDRPEKMYSYMTQDFKSKMSVDEFIACYEKERSYPYITGLYIQKPVISIDKDRNHGKATYDVAARLPGTNYEVEFVYENGDYYIVDWNNFIDGSYLNKFKDCFYTLDWYYDPDNITK